MKENCRHYDPELDCCKLLSDWTSPMPVLQPCIEGPCEKFVSTDLTDQEKQNSAEITRYIKIIRDLEFKQDAKIEIEKMIKLLYDLDGTEDILICGIETLAKKLVESGCHIRKWEERL